ncbi:MAG: nitrous oxide-stimulated promoter family protein [Thermogutta sp.]
MTDRECDKNFRSSPIPAGHTAPTGSARFSREMRTIRAMIRIYCARKHDNHGVLCYQCQELLDYAVYRLERCPFKQKKPTCARCPVHCYKPDKRQQIRQVMRAAGPWMLVYHPYLTFLHYLDEWSRRGAEQPKRWN